MLEHIQPGPRAIAAARFFANVCHPTAINQGLTLDANDLTAVFARELEYIDQELIRTEFAPMLSEELVPYMPEGGPGVDLVTYRMVTEVGRAEWIGDQVTNLPRVDVVGSEYPRKVQNLGDAWAVTVFDLVRIAQAQQHGVSIHLDTERKAAAFEAVKRLHDEAALLGVEKFGWYGLINCPSVPLVVPQFGDWPNVTNPMDIVKDVNKLTWSIVKATKQVQAPDTLLLPLVFTDVFENPYSDSTDFTIRKYVERNSAHIKTIRYLPQLDLADEAGTGPRIMAYRLAKDVVRYGANSMFQEEAPQPKGLDIETPCHGRSSGTQFRRPLAAAYMDGCGDQGSS